MGIWLGPMGSSKFSAKSYTFTGTSSFFSSGDNWEIVLKSSGNLKFKKLPGEIDIFVVGCGSAGKAGSHDLINNQDDKALGGNGGDGGECVTRLSYKDIDLTTSNTYTVTLDVMETKTSIFTIEATNGGKNNHSTGAIAYIGNPGAARVGATTPGGGSLAFGRTSTAVGDRTLYEADLNETIYFGAGGGGGSAVSNTLGGATASSSNGGTTGGGNGGSGAIGGDARPNTGSGGGGGAAIKNSTYNGGAGGTGIIIIRNHRA